MCSPLDWKEEEMAEKLENYFKSDNMSLKEKVFNATLIAQYDLEAQHYCNERERLKIVEFKRTLDSLLEKL